MRRPSGRIARNRVTITPVDFGKDEDGGRPLRPGTPSEPIRCRVHPSSGEDVPEHLREQGVTYLTVHFFEDPGDVRGRDLITWLDTTPPRPCVATSLPRPAAGEMRTWLVDVEYRPPRSTRT